MPKQKSLDVSELERPPPFDAERSARRQQRQISELRASLAAAHMAIDLQERELEVLYGLDDRAAAKKWATPQRTAIGEATGVLLWSDWHPEQVVTLAETNGLNEWGPDHCRRAVGVMIDRTCRVVLPRYRQGAKIDALNVWLGGDFIEGDNRDEQKSKNAMTPIRAAQFVEELLEAGLRELIWRSGAKLITVVTSTGNHDRTTEKTWAAGRNDTSYATIVYDHLRKLFRQHRKIQWCAEEGEMTYHDVYDWRCRFVHGDSIKYRGGRDGLSGPAMIQIRKWNDAKNADFTFFGDKHQFLWNDQGGFVANGALCGAAPYSLRYGKNHPCQAFAVIDKVRGLTDATKVFCR